jgi:hypothetical protein
MKSYFFAFRLSVATVLSAASFANAQSKPAILSTLAAQNFAFCLSSNTSIVISDTVATEVGVVITNVGNSLTNTSGTVVVAANNFYNSGAGVEWTSGMGVFSLPGGSCYNAATMSKTTSPNGSTPWVCAVTSGGPSGAGAAFSGIASTQTQVTSIASASMTTGVSSTLNNAPIVNCTY